MDQSTEENFKFISEASEILSSSLNYQTTLNSVANLAVSRIADWCEIDLVKNSGEIDRVAVAHKNPKKVSWAKKIIKLNILKSDPSTGTAKVMRTGKSAFFPLITQDMIQATIKTKAALEIVKQLNLTSIIIAPLKTRDKVIGAITLISAESKKNFTSSDLYMAEQLASRASLAIENSLLYSTMENERERLNNLLANVPGVVWEASGTSGSNAQRINFVSQYVETMLGYSVDEWLSTPNFWLKCVYGEDKQKAAEESAAIFKSGGKGTSRFRWVSKSGKIFWVESQSSVIKDKQGKPIGTRGVTMDISERMELERRKDELISIASHELKTPVTTLKSFTQILQQYLNNNEKAGYYLSKMNGQIDRLTILINDLLDVSKIQAGKLELNKENFLLDELIKDVVDDMQNIADNHEIFLTNSKNISINADKYRLSQVLINLLSNAIKYSPNSQKIYVNVKKTKKNVTVRIQDFGIGISKKNIPQVFERFFQADNKIRQSFSGLGLGLYISSEIIKRHHGTINVESEKGKGSTFFFHLPRS